MHCECFEFRLLSLWLHLAALTMTTEEPPALSIRMPSSAIQAHKMDNWYHGPATLFGMDSLQNPLKNKDWINFSYWTGNSRAGGLIVEGYTAGAINLHCLTNVCPAWGTLTL